MTRYEFLASILEPLQPRVGVEVGVYYADTTRHLLRNFSNLFMYLIDPYESYPEYVDPLNNINLEAVAQVAFGRLIPYENRYEFHRMRSEEASRLFPANAVDFVFIDANHDYEYVREDILQWRRVVRPNGIIAGHDWSFPDVRRAVDSFGCRVNVNRAADVWYFIKE